jgi:hypothetical protein
MEERLEWLKPGQILYARRSGKESLAALEAFTARLIASAEEVGDQTDVVWHMVDLDIEGVAQRDAMIFLNQIMRHPKVRWFVVVDAHVRGIRRWVAQVMMRLMGIHWRGVDTREDALAFLQNIDSA